MSHGRGGSRPASGEQTRARQAVLPGFVRRPRPRIRPGGREPVVSWSWGAGGPAPWEGARGARPPVRPPGGKGERSGSPLPTDLPHATIASVLAAAPPATIQRTATSDRRGRGGPSHGAGDRSPPLRTPPENQHGEEVKTGAGAVRRADARRLSSGGPSGWGAAAPAAACGGGSTLPRQQDGLGQRWNIRWVRLASPRSGAMAESGTEACSPPTELRLRGVPPPWIPRHSVLRCPLTGSPPPSGPRNVSAPG